MARILLDYSGADIRLFFRILFFVLFLLIGFLGNKCLATRAKLRLVRGRPVPLPSMSSWLSSFDSLVALKTTRTLPGGWLGLLMIAAYLLNLGSDFTSALIQAVPVHDRCKFGTGLVLSASTDPLALIPWNGKPYTVVSAAQVTSLLNYGMQGVYKKANQDTNFSADADDLLGSWQCTRNPLELDYPGQTAFNDILTDIMQHGLLYDDPVSSYAGIGEAGDLSHLVILDTSAGGNVDAFFDVRVSVDISAFENETQRMQSYECKLDDPYGELEPVQKGINANNTFSHWVQVFQGSIYFGTGTPASNNTGGILEQVLNSMTMVAGGNNYLLDNSHADDTQGCITSRTHILWELILLAGLTASILVFLLLYWIGLSIHLRRASRRVKADDAIWLEKFTPVGAFPWMAQAVREASSPQGATVDTGDLKRWHFGKAANEAGYGIISKSGPVAGDEESVPLDSYPAR